MLTDFSWIISIWFPSKSLRNENRTEKKCGKKLNSNLRRKKVMKSKRSEAQFCSEILFFMKYWASLLTPCLISLRSINTSNWAFVSVHNIISFCWGEKMIDFLRLIKKKNAKCIHRAWHSQWPKCRWNAFEYIGRQMRQSWRVWNGSDEKKYCVKNRLQRWIKIPTLTWNANWLNWKMLPVQLFRNVACRQIFCVDENEWIRIYVEFVKNVGADEDSHILQRRTIYFEPHDSQ